MGVELALILHGNVYFYRDTPERFQSSFSSKSLKRIDSFGCFLLLGGSALIVAALQQATERYSFGLAIILVTLICSGAINTYFSGTIFLASVVQIPQLLQTVNGNSAFLAGTQLIAFSTFVPLMATIVAMLIGKINISAVYIIYAGGLLEIIGTIASQYGFQIITSAGVGVFSGALILLVLFIIKRDLTIGAASIIQFRTLGGMIGIAIVVSVMNRVIQSDLCGLSTDIISSFPESVQDSVRVTFGRGYNLQMSIMIGFAVAQILATFLVWTKKPITVTK
ncbi:hypothetical protein BGZ60DRAFT_473439 [Tricladium varicosporioides]|nr:hypothetical protein BGZ60DRAFT_473439 [Hymenoscyphus varicosporioides]